MRRFPSQYELLALIASCDGWMSVAEIPERLQKALDMCRDKPVLVRVVRCGTFDAPRLANLTTKGRAELARHAERGEQRLPANGAKVKPEDVPAGPLLYTFPGLVSHLGDFLRRPLISVSTR
jgi:hypothetical protein